MMLRLSAVRDRRTHGRGLLPGAQRRPKSWPSPAGWPTRPTLNCSGWSLHQIAEPGDCPPVGVTEAIKAIYPDQIAGLQLLAVVQLACPPGLGHDRRVPARARLLMGYKFQFITLASASTRWNESMFKSSPAAMPSAACRRTSELQVFCHAEFAAEADGYSCDQAPARGRHRLLPDQVTSAIVPGLLHHGAGRLDRERAVRRGALEAQPNWQPEAVLPSATDTPARPCRLRGERCHGLSVTGPMVADDSYRPVQRRKPDFWSSRARRRRPCM